MAVQLGPKMPPSTRLPIWIIFIIENYWKSLQPKDVPRDNNKVESKESADNHKRQTKSSSYWGHSPKHLFLSIAWLIVMVLTSTNTIHHERNVVTLSGPEPEYCPRVSSKKKRGRPQTKSISCEITVKIMELAINTYQGKSWESYQVRNEEWPSTILVTQLGKPGSIWTTYYWIHSVYPKITSRCFQDQQRPQAWTQKSQLGSSIDPYFFCVNNWYGGCKW